MRIEALESISYYAGIVPHWLRQGDQAEVDDKLARQLVASGRARAVVQTSGPQADPAETAVRPALETAAARPRRRASARRS